MAARFIAAKDRGVHHKWASLQPSPAITIEQGTDSFDSPIIWLEARNDEGYTFVGVNAEQARAIGIALIEYAAILEARP